MINFANFSLVRLGDVVYDGKGCVKCKKCQTFRDQVFKLTHITPTSRPIIISNISDLISVSSILQDSFESRSDIVYLDYQQVNTGRLV